MSVDGPEGNVHFTPMVPADDWHQCHNPSPLMPETDQ